MRLSTLDFEEMSERIGSALTETGNKITADTTVDDLADKWHGSIIGYSHDVKMNAKHVCIKVDKLPIGFTRTTDPCKSRMRLCTHKLEYHTQVLSLFLHARKAQTWA